MSEGFEFVKGVISSEIKLGLISSSLSMKLIYLPVALDRPTLRAAD